MGSYQAPAAVQLVTLKELVDNTKNDGQIMIGPLTCVQWSAILKTTALFNGRVDVQYEDKTSVMTSQLSGDGGDQTKQDASFNIINPGGGFNYRYRVQIIVITKPTVGACTCYLNYWPPPSNPLY